MELGCKHQWNVAMFFFLLYSLFILKKKKSNRKCINENVNKPFKYGATVKLSKKKKKMEKIQKD